MMGYGTYVGYILRFNQGVPTISVGNLRFSDTKFKELLFHSFTSSTEPEKSLHNSFLELTLGNAARGSLSANSKNEQVIEKTHILGKVGTDPDRTSLEIEGSDMVEKQEEMNTVITAEKMGGPDWCTQTKGLSSCKSNGPKHHKKSGTMTYKRRNSVKIGRPDIAEKQSKKGNVKTGIETESSDLSADQKEHSMCKEAWSKDRGTGTDLSLVEMGNISQMNSTKKLLLSSSRMVVSKGRCGDFADESPSGTTYGSFPKAMDAFPSESSKFREKEKGSPSIIGRDDLINESLYSPPGLVSKISPFGGDITKVFQKKKRAPRRRRGTLTWTIDTLVRKMRNDEYPMEYSLLDHNEKNGNKGELMNNETRNFDPSKLAAIKVDKCSNTDMHRDLGLNEIRKSVRINEKRVLVDCELGIGMETDDACLGSSKWISRESSLLIKEIRPKEVYEEDTKKSCRKDGLTCSTIRHLNHDKLVAMQIDQNSKSTKDNLDMARVGRPLQIRRRNISVNRKLHIDMEGDEFCADSNSFLLRESLLVPQEVGFTIVQETAAINEKATSFLKHECLFKGIDNLECYKVEGAETDGKIHWEVGFSDVQGTSAIPDNANLVCKDESLVNGTDNSECYKVTAIQIDHSMGEGGELLGVGRYEDVNWKYIPTDMDIELGPDADFLDLLKYIDERAAGYKFTNPVTKTWEVENREGSISIPNKESVEVVGQEQLANDDYLNRQENRLKKINELSYPLSGKLSTPGKRSGSKGTNKRKSMGGISPSRKKKKKSGGCGLNVRRTLKEDSEANISTGNKLTLLSRLIDAGLVEENEKIYYKRSGRNGSICRGWVTSKGIRCNCCKKVMPLSEFGVHAGNTPCKVWENIFLIKSETSLMSCLTEMWEKEKIQKKIGFQLVGVGDADPSDDTCGVCADGGSLICCDSCTSTFHQECVKLKALPEGSWDCPYCRCVFCSVNEGRRDEACGTLILCTCQQCGRRYHRECAWGHNIHKVGLESICFCEKECKKVAERLVEKLGVSNPIADGFSWCLLRRLDDDGGITSIQNPSFITECNLKLSLALSVLDECFVLLLDPRTGLDMITQAVYNCGSNFNRLNSEKFHTVILEKNDEIISVASLRIHGTRLAEMPFIGTRPLYRQQGMCRRLLEVVEQLLSCLCVEKLIIPAIPELLETWTTSFSFKPLDLSQREEIRNLNLMIFAGTTLLQKPISTQKHKQSSDDFGADSFPSLHLNTACLSSIPTGFTSRYCRSRCLSAIRS